MCNVLVLLACIPNDEVTNIIEDINPVHKYLFKCILFNAFPSSCKLYDGSTSSFRFNYLDQYNPEEYENDKNP